MSRINVTKTFLPPSEEFQAYVNQIWENGQLTNQGPFHKEFESKIKKYLGVSDFHFVSNGTVALQIALNALHITGGEVITTPFTYVATTSSILWERCEPVFVDIEPETFCIDVDKIEAAITKKTKAIMAVHVFGNPCDVEKIDAIAKKYDLKVIYDGAHSFGVKYKGTSLLSFGDVSITSFHATKVFHTIEGGGVFAKDPVVSDRLKLIKAFGHDADNHFMLGINAKASEFQAAMGLCNLKYVEDIINARKKIVGLYNNLIGDKFSTHKPKTDVEHNYGYYPILFKTEQQLLRVFEKLKELDIFPRRYFYPSLNKLPYLEKLHHCPISENIAQRIACLPLYVGLETSAVRKISTIVADS